MRTKVFSRCKHEYRYNIYFYANLQYVAVDRNTLLRTRHMSFIEDLLSENFVYGALAFLDNIKNNNKNSLPYQLVIETDSLETLKEDYPEYFI